MQVHSGEAWAQDDAVAAKTGHSPAGHVDMAAMPQADVICPQCASGKVKPSVVRTVFWHGDRLVVVEDLPALTCTACHEQFYDDATATILDLMRGQGFPDKNATSTLTVPVFSFKDFLPAVDSEREGVLR